MLDDQSSTSRKFCLLIKFVIKGIFRSFLLAMIMVIVFLQPKNSSCRMATGRENVAITKLMEFSVPYLCIICGFLVYESDFNRICLSEAM